MRLKIATCQFPITVDIRRNADWILKQMKQAKKARADVVHFSEVALGGYAGAQFESFERYDWATDRACAEEIRKAAGKLGLWVVLGANHPLSGKHKPHNSLYIINNRGKIVDRYDKLFCTGNKKGGDLKHYTPGSQLVTFKIKGVSCGALICYDFRFPELYRELYKRGVQLVFHSFHNGAKDPVELKKFNIWGIIAPPTIQSHAACNGMWISANNTSHRPSCWPSFFVNPDGQIAGRLVNNRAGVLVSTVDMKKKFYDAPARWRDRAVAGIFHSGKLVKDKRSDDRKSF